MKETYGIQTKTRLIKKINNNKNKKQKKNNKIQRTIRLYNFTTR